MNFKKIKQLFFRSKPPKLPSPTDDFWYTNPYSYYNENTVDEFTSLRSSAVWACVRVISENIAALPLNLYQDTGNGRVLARSHYLYGLFKNPNKELTQFSLIETIMSHLLLWGNAYLYMLKNNLGEIQLYILGPDRVTVTRKNGNLVYTYHQKDGIDRPFSFDEIIHIPGLAYDGLIGYSPIQKANDIINLSLTAQEYSENFFQNGAIPLSVLKHPSTLSDKARQNLKNSFNNLFGRKGKRFGTAVLEENMDIKTLTINAKDSQLLELRQFQLTEVARIFNVPCHMIQDLSKSSFNNIQELSISFVKYTLNPWINRLEQSFNKKLLPSGKYYYKFKVDGLLRGDVSKRYETYTKAIQNGIMSINEVRAKEELPKIKNGDVHYVPLNMVSVDNTNIKTIENKQGNKRSLEFLKPVVEDAYDRLLRKESLFLQRNIKKSLNNKNVDFNKNCDEFYGKFEKDIANNLRNILITSRSLNNNNVDLNIFIQEYLKESRSKLEKLFEDFDESSIEQAIIDTTEDWKQYRAEKLSNKMIDCLNK